MRHRHGKEIVSINNLIRFLQSFMKVEAVTPMCLLKVPLIEALGFKPNSWEVVRTVSYY